MTNLEASNCPNCGSDAVMFSRKRRIYVCEDCNHEFIIEKPFTPLRIFLSYGHDNNEELVRQIKVDLEKRGHDVWFDKSEIKSGNDWRRSITDGITASHKFVSFLSKHSTRDPGVCLDEIAIAIGVKGGNIQTILVESENDVKPPSSISYIQWLDMHDWKERRDADKAEWKQWYEEKLTEIISVVESDESRRFAGEIETLAEYLKPISSDSRIFQLLRKGLVGRKWLIEAIDKWRESDRASRLFWIMGAPGVGKSAFAAHLAHYGRDKIIAVQFCEYDKPDHRDARRIVRTLAFQIATRLPDYRKFLLTLPEIKYLDGKNPSELFEYLLSNPLKLSIKGGRERCLIIIDALDEANNDGSNELVKVLARNSPLLPEWIGIIVTSRPESNVISPLQGLNPFVLDTSTESNLKDIWDYLRMELATHLSKYSDSYYIIERILEKSEGVFLYIERFCDDVQRGYLSLDDPDQFPQGLGGMFCQFFDRQFPDLEKFRKDIRPALRIILAAREPLPVEILQYLLNRQDEEFRDFTHSLGSLFPVTTDAGQKIIKPYHKSLADWLVDDGNELYYISIVEGNRLLAHFGWLEYERGANTMSRYMIKYLPTHLLIAEQFNKLATLLCDDSFVEAKRNAGMVLNLLHDYEAVLRNDSKQLQPYRNTIKHAFNSVPEEIMAKGVHSLYQEYYHTPHNDFYYLPDDERDQNRLYAINIPKKLAMIGCVMKPLHGEKKEFRFRYQELELLAEMEHERWLREKLKEGWRYSFKNDKPNKTHNAILPWSQSSQEDLARRYTTEELNAMGPGELPEVYKNHDRYLSSNIQTLIECGGYTIKRIENKALIIGVTGHRILMNIDKIEKVIEKSLRQIEKSFQCKSLTVMSSLAIGADTLIVRQVLKNPYSKLIVPLPLPQADYEMDFATEEFIGEFRYLLSKASEIIVMPETARRNESYESAGKYVLENCDVLLTIWDGQGAQGQGGTGEIVALARERKMPIAWIHAGNRKPGTQEPTSLGNEQGKVTFENFP